MLELFQPTHLLFVLLVALVVLGPKRLVGMSREIGQTIQRIQEYKEELKEELTSPPAKEETEEKHPHTVSGSDKKG
jgi:Sec-independent protein translocase protein TatA